MTRLTSDENKGSRMNIIVTVIFGKDAEVTEKQQFSGIIREMLKANLLHSMMRTITLRRQWL